MVNTEALKSEIYRKGYTQRDVYEAIGLTRRQWTIRLAKAVFQTDEAEAIIKFLRIKKPVAIFFANIDN